MKKSSTEYAESLIEKHGNIGNAIKDVESTIEALNKLLTHNFRAGSYTIYSYRLSTFVEL